MHLSYFKPKTSTTSVKSVFFALCVHGPEGGSAWLCSIRAQKSLFWRSSLARIPACGSPYVSLLISTQMEQFLILSHILHKSLSSSKIRPVGIRMHSCHSIRVARWKMQHMLCNGWSLLLRHRCSTVFCWWPFLLSPCCCLSWTNTNVASCFQPEKIRMNSLWPIVNNCMYVYCCADVRDLFDFVVGN